MAITTAQIHAAADQIDKQGNRPTLAAIRTILGGGSFTTIQAAMKEWKKGDDQDEIESAEPVPETVQTAAGQLTAKLWQLAEESANKAFEAKREEHRIELETAIAAKHEALETADALADQQAEQDAKIEQQAKKISLLEIELAQAIRSMQSAHEAATTANTLAQERLHTIQALTKKIATPTKAKQ